MPVESYLDNIFINNYSNSWLYFSKPFTVWMVKTITPDITMKVSKDENSNIDLYMVWADSLDIINKNKDSIIYAVNSWTELTNWVQLKKATCQIKDWLNRYNNCINIKGKYFMYILKLTTTDSTKSPKIFQVNLTVPDVKDMEQPVSEDISIATDKDYSTSLQDNKTQITNEDKLDVVISYDASQWLSSNEKGEYNINEQYLYCLKTETNKVVIPTDNFLEKSVYNNWRDWVKDLNKNSFITSCTTRLDWTLSTPITFMLDRK